MAKISFKCRSECRGALQSANVESDISDSALDNCVRHARRESLRSNSDSAKEQAEGLVIALRPFKDLVLESAEDKGLDHDDYGELFWALLKGSLVRLGAFWGASGSSFACS